MGAKWGSLHVFFIPGGRSGDVVQISKSGCKWGSLHVFFTHGGGDGGLPLRVSMSEIGGITNLQ